MKKKNSPKIPKDEILLFSEEQIRHRIQKVAMQISEKYKGQDIVLVAVLKGAVIFYTFLSQEIQRIGKCRRVYFDILRVSSYGNGQITTGEVQILFDPTQPLIGKNIIIIEDVVDTKLTLDAIIRHIMTKKPQNLNICSLIVKKPDPRNLKAAYQNLDMEARKRVENCEVDFACFSDVEGFLIGFGMDEEGDKRGQPFITAKKNSL